MLDDRRRTTNERRPISNQLARINPRRSSAPYSPFRILHELQPQSRTEAARSSKDARLKKNPASLRGHYNRHSHLPVPVRLEACGLLLALSATLNFPVLVPTAFGLNTTLIVQLVLAARLAPQVVVETLKSPVVEITMLLSVTVW